jgi:urease accessory protein
MKTTRRTITMLLLALPVLAQAHAGPHTGDALLAGLAHPFSGLDHLAAMLAVGFWAALAARRGRADLMLVPASFVALLSTGALMAAAGLAIPLVEPMVATSLLAFGLLIARQAALPLPWAMPLIGVFAFFHGAAHGAELGDGTALVGMVLGSAALHALGMVAALVVRHRSPAWPHAAGAVLGLMGVSLLVGSLT